MADFKVQPTVNGNPVTEGDINNAPQQTVLENTDKFGIVDTSGTPTMKYAFWSVIKTELTTLFDGLYGRLVAANAWTKNNSFNSTDTSGSALSAVRNQATTTAPVLDIKEDNASSSQPVARFTGDGTGPIIQGFDTATKVFELSDGGTLSVYTVIKALSASGIQVQDDGGNVSMLFPDWGAGGAALGVGTTDVELVGSSYGGMQLGATSLLLYGRSGATGLYLADNGYYDGQWKRRTGGVATMYQQNSGVHSFYHVATNPTIDTVFTWVEIMRLTPTGMGIFQASPSYPLHIGTGSVTPSGGFGGVNASVKALFADNTTGKYPQVAISGDAGGSVEFYDSGTGVAAADFGIAFSTANLAFLNRMTSGLVEFWSHNGTALARRLGITSTGSVQVNAGTASNEAAVGGVLLSDAATAGSAAATSGTIKTFSVVGNTLAVNNQSLWAEASGTIAATGASKTLSLNFGGASVTISVPGSIALEWELRFRVFRTGAATIKFIGRGSTNNASGTVPTNYATGTPTLSSANSVTITWTSTSGTLNDFVVETFIVGWDDANS